MFTLYLMVLLNTFNQYISLAYTVLYKEPYNSAILVNYSNK